MIYTLHIDNHMYDVIVIGGGPAGLMAANTAAINGLRVLLLEKMEKPARKLRITGKGRCNITNTKPLDEFLKKVYPNSNFFKPALKNLTNNETILFFNKIGVKTVIERGNRVFPASQKAWDIAEALLNEATKNGVTILCNSEVIELTKEHNIVKTVICKTEDGIKKYKTKVLVLATGGLSYPLTGSTGDGYKFAEDLGHTIVKLRPSLTAIEVEKPELKLDKLELKNVKLLTFINGNFVKEEFGEMKFTKFGIDGPIVLKTSRIIVDALLENKKINLAIDFKPALSFDQLVKRINREVKELSENSKIINLLSKLLPKQLIESFAEKINLSINKPINKLNETTIKNIAKGLKSFTMIATGYRPFKEAIITAGGINLSEINPKTLQSKIIDNLYFAGEIIDIDADTGGYNLQIAFSTGYLAGLSIAKKIKS